MTPVFWVSLTILSVGYNSRHFCARALQKNAQRKGKLGGAHRIGPRPKGILVRWGLLRLPERQKSMVRGLLKSF